MTSPRSRRPSPSCAAATVPWCSTSTPQKGHGYAPAAADPEGWHHAVPFDVATGEILPRRGGPTPLTRNYANVTGALLMDWMHTDPRVVAVNAATPYIMASRRSCASARAGASSTWASPRSTPSAS